ncbi:MAG: type III-B CRISPR-associated protein Cas10/Cmr2 [Spirochaetales bacterium]|nr:type III-B CRISPR-associated protein Cas10/Cmr2 [Spirochaetales bacterium]
MKYLLHLFISPVQSFIARARKTTDLFGGSSMLSGLTAYAIKRVMELQWEIIFPGKNATGNGQSFPNRLVVKIENKTANLIREKVNTIKQAMMQQCVTNYEKALSYYNEKDKSLILSKGQNQWNSLFEIQWAAVPCNDNYTDSYNNLMELTKAVKNTRTFTQLNEAGGRKCSLCGERNILFYSNERKKPPPFSEKAVPIAGIDEKEGLCAPCFTKRFYNKESFPSTAGIAAMNWLENNKVREEAEEFKNCFKEFNDQLYYKENLTEEYVKKNNYLKDPERLEKAKTMLSEWYREYKEPSRYYALVMFDGDNMGQWLSGKFLEKNSNLEEFHKKFSDSLSEFSEAAKKVLTTPKGEPVYAGGDDFMGFVNLAYVFESLTAWENLFKELVNDNLADFIKDNKKFTFSAGVVIAHYKTPLQEVIKAARRMEKEAKAIEEKNRIGIAFITKSNTIYTAIITYRDKTILKKLVKVLIKKEGRDTLSSSFIFNFCRQFGFFEKYYKPEESELIAGMMMTELKRLMIRSTENKTQDAIWKHESLYNEIKNFFYSLNHYKRGIEYFDINSFVSFLKLADKLSREMGNVYQTDTP